MDDKVGLMTGATNGIGIATVGMLARKDAMVGIVRWDTQKEDNQCPPSGFCINEFRQEQWQGHGCLVSIFAPLVAPSPAKSAETSIYTQRAGVTGKYFHDTHAIPAASQATDKVVAREL